MLSRVLVFCSTTSFTGRRGGRYSRRTTRNIVWWVERLGYTCFGGRLDYFGGGQYYGYHGHTCRGTNAASRFYTTRVFYVEMCCYTGQRGNGYIPNEIWVTRGEVPPDPGVYGQINSVMGTCSTRWYNIRRGYGGRGRHRGTWVFFFIFTDTNGQGGFWEFYFSFTGVACRSCGRGRAGNGRKPGRGFFGRRLTTICRNIWGGFCIRGVAPRVSRYFRLLLFLRGDGWGPGYSF